MGYILKPLSGNRMLSLKREIRNLKEILAKTHDPDRIKLIKKSIIEKQLYYNILADRLKTR